MERVYPNEPAGQIGQGTFLQLGLAVLLALILAFVMTGTGGATSDCTQ